MSNKKRILIMVTEGQTDEEFYKKVTIHTKNKCNCKRYCFDEIKHMCAYGIGKMDSKILAKFNFEICQSEKYKNSEKVVCLCYDLDVFKVNKKNPPIDREKLKKQLYNYGADKVIEIIADDMIEDFFLFDIEGIKKYLNLKKKYKLPKKREGLELLKKMFKDGNKIYSKGDKAAGLIDSLDFDLILSHICDQVSKLCDELGYNCKKNTCKIDEEPQKNKK